MDVRTFCTALFLLMVASFVTVSGADAVESGGSGHGDGIDLSYYFDELQPFAVMTVSLSNTPADYFDVLVISADDDQRIEHIEPSREVKVDLRPLEDGSYTVMVILDDVASTIVAECELFVGDTFAVMYDPNGGSGSMTPSQVKPGESLKLPICTFDSPSGKTFDCWEINGKHYSAGQSAAISEDTVAKAVWKDADHYVVTYLPEGGTGSMPSVSVIAGGTLVLPSCGFSAPEGKVFSSWSIDNKSLRSGDSILVDRDLTAKAQWSSSSSDGEMDLTVIVAIGAVIVALIAVITIVLRRKV